MLKKFVKRLQSKMRITEKALLRPLTAIGILGSGCAAWFAITPKTIMSKLIFKGFSPLETKENSNVDKDKWIVLSKEYKKDNDNLPNLAELHGSTDSIKAEELKNHCRDILKIPVSKDNKNRFYESSKKWCTKDSYYLEYFKK